MISEQTAIDDTLVARLMEEFTDRLNRGEQPTIEEYARRYPHLAEPLRQVLSAVQMMGHLGDDAHPLADSSLDAPNSADTDRQALGDFRIVREIGRGGMAVVYEAEQLSLKRRVALKVLPFAAVLDERHLQRFKNEALAAAQLEHPHIVPVYGVGCDRGVHHYAMKYIQGQTLAAAIAELRRASGAEQNGPADALAPTVVGKQGSTSAPLPRQQRSTALAALSTAGSATSREFFRSAAMLGRNIAGALDYAHQHGVVHRDIKPSNLMLDTDGKAWVTDFGLAHIESDVSLTMSGDLLGTLRYMSPEQVLAKRVIIDHRTDIYSLGVTLYELLTLQPAYPENDRQQLLQRISFEDPTPPRKLNPHLPADLETIILKATAKNPHERYETAQELADDLQRFLNHETIKARRPTLRQRLAKWTLRHTALVSSASVILLITTVLASATGALLLSERSRTLEALAQEQNQREYAREQEQQARRSESEALHQRDAALQNLYYAEIVSGQADQKQGNISSLHRKLVDHLPVNGEEDLRGWEWYYLFSLCRPEERTMYRRAMRPFASWSPDGEYVATAGTIWSARSGECVREFSPSRIMRCSVAWSPDGQRFAWCKVQDDNGIYIWDRQTDRVTSLRGHENSVWCLAWSPDGTQLASGSVDWSVKIWDAVRGVTLQTLPVDHYVRGVAWSPDGALLAAGVGARALKIWKLSTGELVADRKEVDRYVRVSWHPDGGQLAVCTDSNWYLLDSTDWTVVREQRHTPGSGRDIAWNPSGTRLAVAHGEVVTIWDPAGEQPVATLRGHLRPLNSVAWSPDGTRLVTSDNVEEVRIWDWNSPIQLQPIPSGGPVESLAWLIDGPTLAAISAEDNSISFWDATQGTLIRVEQAQAEGPALWSPDRRLLAVRAGTDEDPEIRVLEAGTGAVHSVWKAPAQHRLHSLVWSPDAAKIAIETSFEGYINLVFWDVDREQTISRWRKKQHYGESSTSIQWADDSARVAVAAAGDVGDSGSVAHDYHAHIVNVAKGRRILKHKLGGGLQEGEVTAVAWNRSGDLLACGGSEGLIEVVDVDSGETRVKAKPHNAQIESVVWSPDGRRLASASQDGTVKVIAAQDGAELLRFTFEEDLPTQLTWSPDHRRLAAATEGGTIHVWDASRAYEFSIDGSRRSELAWVYFQRGVSNGPQAGEPALREFLRLAPDTLGFWQERGHANAVLSEFDRAAQEFAKAIGPDIGLSFQPAYCRALALLGAGSVDVYREFCASLGTQFADSQVPSNKNYVAWLTVLSPNPLVDSEEVLRMARALHDYETMQHDTDSDYSNNGVLIIGASLFRDGQFEKAVETLTTLAEKLNRGGDASDRYGLACAQYFIALARHQLGHDFQARRHLAEAVRHSDAYRQIGHDWESLVALDALQRETDAALSGLETAVGK